MKLRSFIFGSMAALALIGAVSERDAQACGGCFVPPGPNTQVTAHRMAFAVSAKRTILWDQIQYVGAPSEFGWVLPIRGKVDVGVSSDQLFQRLENETSVQIVGPPQPICPSQGRGLAFGGGESNDLASASPSAADSGVNVWDQKVVGPYEATQLSATDGTALTNWLNEHNYTLPPAVAPVIDQYIKEGFGFLVIKLVPSADTTRMVPIRIAYEGGGTSLPLRMIAAGSGAKVGLKLFVIGEGRWDTKNFPTAQIKDDELIWDYAAMGSNYNPVFLQKLALDGGRTWVAESSDDIARSKLFSGLPPGTTESDAGTVFATNTDESDIEAAFPGRASVTVTRLFAELPQSALNTDLELQASTGGKIPRVRNVTQTANHPCPGSDSGGSVFGCNAGASSGRSARDESSSPLTWMGALFAGALVVSINRRRRS
jgi:hypothetical protein